MKRNSVLSIIKLFFIVLLLSGVPSVLKAQTNFDQTESDGGDIEDTPVNGGVVVLLIAGVGYGAFKIYKIKSQAKLSKAL